MKKTLFLLFTLMLTLGNCSSEGLDENGKKLENERPEQSDTPKDDISVPSTLYN